MGNPSTAFSGNNVLGYERSAEYGNSMDPEYLTTQSFNFEDFSDVQLKYRRFLGVEGYYDNASVEITNNGVDWHTIWSNSVNTYDDESKQNSSDTCLSNFHASGQHKKIFETLHHCIIFFFTFFTFPFN